MLIDNNNINNKCNNNNDDEGNGDFTRAHVHLLHC